MESGEKTRCFGQNVKSWKFFQKKWKKGVDFCVQIWYSIKAPRERGYGSNPEVEKKFQKSWKKFLTSACECDIIINCRVTHGSGRGETSEWRFVPCKLNNVEDKQRRCSVQGGPRTERMNKIITLKLCLEQSSNKRWYQINDINFLESLILAQDERWRRA